MRKIHNEELNDLYCPSKYCVVIKWRGMCWVVHVARMVERGDVYSVLGVVTEGKRPLGEPG
jgi:hypothetical protein